VRNNLLQRPGVGGSGSSGSTSVSRGRKKDRETELATDREKPFSCECEYRFLCTKWAITDHFASWLFTLFTLMWSHVLQYGHSGVTSLVMKNKKVTW